MMSITEAERLYIDRRPVYNTKDIYIYRGEDIVFNSNPKPYGKVSPGYLGQVIGVRTEQGTIYLEIDDVNVYNDGISFYIVADKDAIVTNEADAPVKTPGFFERLYDNVINAGGNMIKFAGSGLLKIALIGIVAYAGFRALGDETKETIKDLGKKAIDTGKKGLEKLK